MQASRFEQKYLISEETAQQVRDFVQSYLELDENGVGKPDFSYPVHSLYLDSEDFKLYWSTINGDKNRFKLRLRFYNDNPDTPVFFEIKRRMNNCITKQRGGARREAVERLLAGHLPDPADLVGVTKDLRHLHALERFCQLMQGIRALPRVHVGYLREAYVPHDDNSARLTMDRRVQVETRLTPHLVTQMDQPVPVWGREVVLELKFTNRFPEWFRKLVQVFGLRQRGAAKYVDGVELLEDFGLSPRHSLETRAGAAGRREVVLQNSDVGTNLIHKDVSP
jgi:hypothetical protein